MHWCRLKEEPQYENETKSASHTGVVIGIALENTKEKSSAKSLVCQSSARFRWGFVSMLQMAEDLHLLGRQRHLKKVF
jgi:hypothetical protein